MKYSYLLLIPLSLILVLSSTSDIVLSISTAQRNLYLSGVNWFDVDNSNNFCGDGSLSSRPITPGKLYILGDSIVEGGEDYLREKFTGDWNTGTKNASDDRINGLTDRSVSAAVTEINNDKSLVSDSVAIVIALGTNDALSNFSGTITSTIAAIREHNPTAPIFWVDIAITLHDASPANSGIHSSASGEKYEVIPWFTTVFPGSNPISAAGVTDSQGYLDDAGVHPNDTGYPVYSQLMFDVVSKYRVVGTTGSSSGTVNLIGSNNEEKVYNYFRSRGLSPVQSAAIVGNYMVETRATMDPSIKQGSLIGGKIQTFSSISEVENSDGRLGYGLAQWTHDSRQTAWVSFVRENGHTITDLGSQLEWTWYELGSNSAYGKEEFTATTDLRQSTWVFVSFYERPGSISGHEKSLIQPTSGSAKDSLDARHGYAKEALSAFGNNPVYGIDSVDLCLVGTDSTDFSRTGVRIDRSTPWTAQPQESFCETTSDCTGGFTEGAKSLEQFVLDTWQPHVTGVGGYCCRAINGDSSKTSIHGSGRAIDIYIDADGGAQEAQGNQIRNWMINNSVEVGVQRVIWNKYSWNSEQDGWNPYEGADDHTDHLHVEINEDGANKILPWYVGR